MKSKKVVKNLFYEVFGKKELPNGDLRWSELVFTDSEPKTLFRYVGWVDVMGASHMMRRSIDAASKSIGRLHEAVINASFELNAYKRLRLHPLADGVYVVAKRYDDVADIIAYTFRSYAQTYIEMKSESRFTPIRAAIAYGRVADQGDYIRKLMEATPKDNMYKMSMAYFRNVLHGRAYVAAHEAESKAPPFGIFHDDSLREFGKTKNKTNITWPLEKWWCHGRAATQQQKDFATSFGQCLLDHFNWIAEHPMDSGMTSKVASDKIEEYKRLVKEYFGLTSIE